MLLSAEAGVRGGRGLGVTATCCGVRDCAMTSLNRALRRGPGVATVEEDEGVGGGGGVFSLSARLRCIADDEKDEEGELAGEERAVVGHIFEEK